VTLCFYFFTKLGQQYFIEQLYVILGPSVCSECQPTEHTCKILFMDKFMIPVKHYLSVIK